MKKLKVDIEDISMIMDNQDRLGNQFYLDTETGETIVIPDELMTAFHPLPFHNACLPSPLSGPGPLGSGKGQELGGTKCWEKILRFRV